MQSVEYPLAKSGFNRTILHLFGNPASPGLPPLPNLSNEICASLTSLRRRSKWKSTHLTSLQLDAIARERRDCLDDGSGGRNSHLQSVGEKRSLEHETSALQIRCRWRVSWHCFCNQRKNKIIEQKTIIRYSCAPWNSELIGSTVIFLLWSNGLWSDKSNLLQVMLSLKHPIRWSERQLIKNARESNLCASSLASIPSISQLFTIVTFLLPIRFSVWKKSVFEDYGIQQDLNSQIQSHRNQISVSHR